MIGKRGDVRMKVLMIVTAVLALGLLFVAAEQFIDYTKANFDAGTYSNTRYFNISQSGLPDNGNSSGPIDMTGNVLLYHMDDSSGNIIDTSGSVGSPTITTDGAYTVVTFKSTGTFTPSAGLTNVQVLVVAGGGGGGSNHAGGGGAGGLIYNSSYAFITNSNITINVGSGGFGSSVYEVLGGNGGNSTFGNITAVGGGGGGVRTDAATPTHGLPGGSGGGGGGGQNTKGLGGAASPAGQGNNGGDAYAPGAGAASSGGGGGGAGGVGANGGSYSGGNGGAGLAYSISGSSVTYSVGGKGGDSSNTGTRDSMPGAGGGGGASNTGAGTSGLSGTVIVRYLTASGNATATHTPNNGIVSGGVTYSASGQVGSALGFDGSGSYVELPGNGNLAITEKLTISGWVKTTSADGSNPKAIATKGTASVGDGYNLIMTAGNNPNGYVCQFQLRINGGWTDVTGKTQINDGNWHLCTGTFDGSNIRIYADGNLEGTTSAPGSIDNLDHPFRVGRWDTSDSTWDWNGAIDEVAVWNKTLSDAEISYMYTSQKDQFANYVGMQAYNASSRNLPDSGGSDSGIDMTGNVLLLHMDEASGASTAVDSSGNANTGTFSGGVTSGIPGQVGSALGFDGSTGYVSASDSSGALSVGTGDFTYSFWAKLDSSPNDYNNYFTYGKYPEGILMQFTHYSNYDAIVLFVNGQGTTTTLYGLPHLGSGGSWHMITAKRVAGIAHIYVDGIEQSYYSTGDLTGSVNPTDKTLYVGLGGGDWGGDYFKGNMDELSIWNRSLSDAEIQSTYNRQKGVYGLGAPSSYVSKIFNAGLGQWYNLSWVSSSYGELSDNGFDERASGNFVDGVNMSGNVLLYHMNGGAVKDSSGQGNDGTQFGGASLTSDGKFGNAVNFDSSGGRIEIPDSEKLRLASTPFSICAWVNLTELRSSSSFLSKGHDSYSGGGWVIWADYGNIQFWTTSGNQYGFNSNMVAGQWNYFCITGHPDSGTEAVSFYLNGQPDGSTNMDPEIFAQTDNLKFGGVPGWGSSFYGKMDEIGMWNRELSAGEISALYNSGTGQEVSSSDADLVGLWHMDESSWPSPAADSSGQANDGTASTTTDAMTTGGKIGSALNFDGSSNYVESSSTPTTITEKTLMAWVKLSDLDQQAGGVVGIQLGYGDPGQFDSIVYGEQISRRWMAGSNGFSRTFNSDPGTEENSTDWVHMTITYKENDYKMYRNGVLIGQSTDYGLASYTPGSMIYAGKRHNVDTGLLNAAIDDARVYDRVLSQSEIEEIYNSGTGTESELSGLKAVVHYKMNDNAATTKVVDSAGYGNPGTIVGGVSGTTGKIDGALKFDGSSGYISVSNMLPGII
ncbi:MAG: LamG domain-containing protein, partial [archaeon]